MNIYLWLADFVVVFHLSYVLFVVFGLVAILVGRLLKWGWVRNKWFRLIHLTMIAIVVVESLLSITCPLTTLENYLRVEGGQAAGQGSFVGRLAHDLLFFDFTPQFFTVVYCLFGGLVFATLFIVPIRWKNDSSGRVIAESES